MDGGTYKKISLQNNKSAKLFCCKRVEMVFLSMDEKRKKYLMAFLCLSPILKIGIFKCNLKLLGSTFRNFHGFDHTKHEIYNNMSLPNDCQSALDALNEIGGRLKDAKTAGTDVAPILEEFNTAKAALDTAIRPVAEEEQAKDSAFFWDVLGPIFVRVMSKSEKKKYEKTLKKRKKSAESGAGSAATSTGGDSKSAGAGGEEKVSKKELKRREKAAKKAAAKAKNAAEKANAAAPASTKSKTAAASAAPAAPASSSITAAPVSAAVDATPYAALIIAAATGNDAGRITNGDELDVGNGVILRGAHTIARYFCLSAKNHGLYGAQSGEKDPATRCNIDQWIDMSLVGVPSDVGMKALDSFLEGHTYCVGYGVTLADVCLYGRLVSHGFNGTDRKRPHIARWFRHLSVLDMFKGFAPKVQVKTAAGAAAASASASASAPSSSNGSGKGLHKVLDLSKYDGMVDKNGKPLSDSAKKKLAKKEAKAAKKAAHKKDPKKVTNDGGETKKQTAEEKYGRLMGNLKNATEGEVVTRFPPEPSGFLHIGHAKAVLLNNFFARKHGGKLIVRFDDTNPSKEKVEFEEAILSDLQTLGVEPDMKTHTSDHFELIMKKAKQLIKQGDAYMDNTGAEEMKVNRMNCVAYEFRDRSAKENLKLFELMCTGSKDGQQWCMRAKIDMDSKNGCLRDPVFFRTNLTPHHRTHAKYKAYPTYDLACPIVDSTEGVTHAMRSMEYTDRNVLYNWVLEKFQLRKVNIQGFARVNFNKTLMSKRKLQQLVDAGSVDGWNDPRFPTVQGITRRGLRVTALNRFLLELGFGKRPVDMTWDKLWARNRQFIDPTSVRYHAVAQSRAIVLTLTNIEKTPHQIISTKRHPKFDDKNYKGEPVVAGYKATLIAKEILLEGPDVNEMVTSKGGVLPAVAVGDKITLMQWGNIKITGVTLDKDNKTIVSMHGEYLMGDKDYSSTKRKLQWVANTNDKVSVSIHEYGYLLNKDKITTDDDGNYVDGGKIVDFDHFLTPLEETHAEFKCWAESGVKNVCEDDIVQFQRLGFFRCDKALKDELGGYHFFTVPDGKAKSMSNRQGKLSHQ